MSFQKRFFSFLLWASMLALAAIPLAGQTTASIAGTLLTSRRQRRRRHRDCYERRDRIDQDGTISA